MSGLDEQARKLEEAAAAARAVQAPGTDLIPTAQSAAQAKRQLASIRAEATRRSRALQKQAKALEAKAQEMVRKAQAELGPLQELMERMQEGIWTVNLYLGRNEEILSLLDGEPADALEPIVVRQLVLAMDQECAVNAEKGGIDAIDIDEFDAWLQKDPAHVEQVIPERKGVVALVPRYDHKDYGDPWKTATVAAQNKQTYFLIRNGDKLWRCWTDFIVGKHLVPGPDEFTRYFQRRSRLAFDSSDSTREDYEPLEPGSAEWLDAQEKAEARQRHYMRAALILEGLLHRTTVFHPHHPQGVSFLSPTDHRDGKVRFVLDATKALTDGKETFREWQRRLNAQLRPGQRVIGFFGYGSAFRGEDYDYRAGNSRLHPATASKPDSGRVYTLERNRKGKLVFRYERDDEVYDASAWRDNPDRPGWGWRGEFRKPKTRASCIVEPDDSWIIPYDLTTVEEMERWITSRGSRPSYADMFPILKAAIKAKRAEDAEEEPFRQMLLGVLVRDVGTAPEATERAVPDLVHWWKQKNLHHRALIGTEEEQAKAVREITEEWRRRQERVIDDHPEVLEALRSDYPDHVFIGRKNDGSWIVLSPERPRENRWLRQRSFTRTGKPREDRRWVLWAAHMENWTTVVATSAWEKWNRRAQASEDLTDPERKAIVEQIREHYADKDQVAIAYREAYWRSRPIFQLFTYKSGARISSKRFGDDRGPLLEEWTVSWERREGEVVKRWDDRGTDAGEVINDRSASLLWSDPERTEKFKRERERYEAAQKQKREWVNVRYGVWERLREALKDAHWAEQRRLFREDYGEDADDEDVWEGHRKTLPRYQGQEDLRDDAERIIEAAIEADLPLVGRFGDLAAAVGLEAHEALADLNITPEPEEPEDDEELEEFELKL